VHRSQQAIDLVARLLVDPGDTVVLEEPHYTGFSFCLVAVGARLAYVPVDEQGLRTDALVPVADARGSRASRKRGVGVYPAAPFRARPPAHAELLLGYAALRASCAKRSTRWPELPTGE
jgi:DNA-binding transcriptional MocR family regulator